MPNPLSTIRRAAANGRITKSGGRQGGQRSTAPRCPCDADTLGRAQQRAGKDGKCPAGDGHDPSCTFYRETAIIV